jgi:hypothetical protein
VAKPQPQVVYPTFHPDHRHPSTGELLTGGGPTPHSFLVVCTRCGVAEWRIPSNRVEYHQCPGHAHAARMRNATSAEIVAGRKALEGGDRA